MSDNVWTAFLLLVDMSFMNTTYKLDRFYSRRPKACLKKGLHEHTKTHDPWSQCNWTDIVTTVKPSTPYARHYQAWLESVSTLIIRLITHWILYRAEQGLVCRSSFALIYHRLYILTAYIQNGYFNFQT